MRAGNWLPAGKRAAVCFSIDDVHPGKSTDAYEAGGDLGRGALRHLEWLLDRHPDLHATLFVTADWRMKSPRIVRSIVARVPVLRDRAFLTDLLPEGTMRLDRHPEFSRYLRSLPRTDVALHGLHHVRSGNHPAAEYLGASYVECRKSIERCKVIFAGAGLSYSRGICPPCWEYSLDLGRALTDCDIRYVTSARDLTTPVTREALAAMSGLHGVSLCHPEILPDANLIHFTTNFQATSDMKRAFQIVNCGGLLSIKAHVAKNLSGQILLDGLDDNYASYLDRIMCELEDRYGSALWWTSMQEITTRISHAPYLVHRNLTGSEDESVAMAGARVGAV
jgi:peptidoglycan/xylan/chitin deacetylase (PgdA/CDA1 family)